MPNMKENYNTPNKNQVFYPLLSPQCECEDFGVSFKFFFNYCLFVLPDVRYNCTSKSSYEVEVYIFLALDIVTKLLYRNRIEYRNTVIIFYMKKNDSTYSAIPYIFNT